MRAVDVIRKKRDGQALSSEDIVANRFRVVLRDLLPDEEKASADCLAAVARDGLPNYFDQQRFGSAAELAAYVLWSATVAPEGFMKRRQSAALMPVLVTNAPLPPKLFMPNTAIPRRLHSGKTDRWKLL